MHIPMLINIVSSEHGTALVPEEGFPRICLFSALFGAGGGFCFETYHLVPFYKCNLMTIATTHAWV